MSLYTIQQISARLDERYNEPTDAATILNKIFNDLLKKVGGSDEQQ